MDFIDDYDDNRPRFLLQSRPLQSSTSINSPQTSHKNKLLISVSLFFSLIFLLSSLFFFNSQLLQSIFLWFSLSLLVGPFAPLSITGGDIRVGQGSIVEFPPQTEAVDVDESKKKGVNKRIRGKRSDLYGVSSNGSFEPVKNGENCENSEGFRADSEKNDNGFLNSGENVTENDAIEERDWDEIDLGLLRKQITKHPIGKPRRWEVIAEAFKGRHSVESVINKAKSLGKEKPVDSDSYSKFLKDRKPVDKRVVEGGEEGGGVVVWSSSEDIALLNALKAFPKDVAMRWEKISSSVPGKSKAACMKRVSELKKEFRSSKTSNES